MSKYEIEMEITGFKLKIKGEHTDIPVIRDNLNKQFANLITPATNIAQQELPFIEAQATPTQPTQEPENKGKRKSGPRIKRAAANGEASAKVVAWTHSPDKWGTPKQAWKAWEKILYFMYVASEETGIKELSSGVIANTFNQLFRQAGALHVKSMPRDLADLKQRSTALVGDNRTVSPYTWFLTDEGIKNAKTLLVAAKGTEV